MVNPLTRWVPVNGSAKHAPLEQVILVLLDAVQVTGLADDDPFVQVITDAPMISRSFAGSVRAEDHVALPAGTRIVSPEAAAVRQSLTSVRLAEAAVRVGLEPEQAAAAGLAELPTINTTITAGHNPGSGTLVSPALTRGEIFSFVMSGALSRCVRSPTPAPS